MHLLIKFYADIFIHCGDAFNEIQDGRRPASWICWGNMGPPTKAHARCVLPLKHL